MDPDLLFMLRLMSFSEVDWKPTPAIHVFSISAVRTFRGLSCAMEGCLVDCIVSDSFADLCNLCVTINKYVRKLTNVSYKIKLPLIEFHYLRTSSASGAVLGAGLLGGAGLGKSHSITL